MRVICIDPPKKIKCHKYGMKQLEFMKEYTVRGERNGVKGMGYLLEGVHNYFITSNTGQRIEADYLAARFIPITTNDIVEKIERISNQY